MEFCKEWKQWVRGAALVTAASGVVFLSAAPGYGQEDVTVQGEILDLACYMAKGSKGAQHKACARMCAKKGAPMGVLTESGDVYLLVDDHDDPEPYEALKKIAGDRAEVKGKKFSKGGVAAIMVTDSKGL